MPMLIQVQEGCDHQFIQIPQLLLCKQNYQLYFGSLKRQLAKESMIELRFWRESWPCTRCPVLYDEFRKVAPDPKQFIVKMYVEDRKSHVGPFSLPVHPEMTVSNLKKKVEAEYNIPAKESSDGSWARTWPLMMGLHWNTLV
ncbi:hypothetical protein MRX96_010418 [Rhipicephalus microplus]